MYQIMVCDDDVQICAHIENTLLEYMAGTGEKIEITVSCNGTEILKLYDEGITADLLFLDIELNDRKGFDIAREIRKRKNGRFVQIVFISAYTHYAMDLFSVQPLDFIIKPLTKQNIIDCLTFVKEYNKVNRQRLQVKQGHGSKWITVSEIIKIESRGKSLFIHTKEDVTRVFERLDHIYDLLKENPNIIRVHKSFLINMDYIRAFAKARIIMEEGSEIPVSAAYQQKVYQRLTQTRMGKENIWKM